ncbi:uncharacterized protein LOC132168924 [Corylus avellana]|uniref:uncharacterized protein LOC132168924 n=1 Tax=Corylus avellana TaxID=13451 RepID=UPI001E1FFFDF|nr:uncharacterized protein LOC132168924 [Corylus avellana]XP_059435999.1 uncharacterized protein LOC132168924 [Corylus avellana]XP_059436000.1 uncharacterized protein LOC132168924 [Corylus avellana]
MGTASPQNLEEYSATSTVTTFDRPVPLLRGPIRAGPLDDPSTGPYVLAFRDPQAWASAFKSCESKLVDQCEHGARVGCAIAASNKCKLPWWRAMVGQRATDLSERERCEEREMEGCVLAAKEKCIGFARDKCATPFRDARVAVREGRVRMKDLGKLIAWAPVAYRSTWVNLIGLDQLGGRVLAVTNYRASELLGPDTNFERVLKSGN